MAAHDMRGGNYAAELQDVTIYKARRRRLAEKLGGGTAVLWGNGDDRGAGDIGTFRQDSVFFYFTGVELPNAVMALRPGDGGDFLFLPPRDPDVERWTGPKWGPGDETAAALGFDHVWSTSASQVVLDARIRPVPGFEGRLQSWLGEDGGTLWTVYPSLPTAADPDRTHHIVNLLRERTTTFAVRDLSDHVADLRIIKDNGEVGLIRKAVEMTIAGQRAAAQSIRPGVKEGAVDGAVYAAFREAGAEGVAFPTIVGSGYNATTLHYDHNAGVCEAGDLVVVDIGARYGYYCGDITRTFPVNGSFGERQRALYNLVLEAHDRVAEAIKPGMTIFGLRKIAYGVFQDSELRDGRGERLGQYFIHGLGHFLGLDAHDPGADDLALEPGMVLTNEPGLYLPEESTGIRIENDHLVTAYGNENLSASLPTAADEIEAMMAGF